jgi:predicted DNA-binding transcriptional regulator AlpA
MEYEFELRFKLPADDADVDELVERLGEAGCDDALIGIGQPGRIALRFTREAESAKRAIVSALEDVKSVIPAAKFIEVGPDFVGLTDVAEMLGMSRQNMRKLMVTHAGSFPAPIHEGSTTVWHLEHVLQWLRSRGDYGIEQRQIDVAHIAMQINLAKEADRLELPVQREVQALVA